jgi:hypothetical protein
LSTQCGILNISNLYRPPRLVKGIALLYYSFPNFPTSLKELPDIVIACNTGCELQSAINRHADTQEVR